MLSVPGPQVPDGGRKERKKTLFNKCLFILALARALIGDTVN